MIFNNNSTRGHTGSLLVNYIFKRLLPWQLPGAMEWMQTETTVNSSKPWNRYF